MIFQRIATDLRAQSQYGGEDQEFSLRPTAGGHMVKVVNYMVVIRQSSGPAAEVGLKFNHGPDGKNSVLHSIPIANSALTSGVVLLSGDATITKVIGEWLHPILVVGSTGATEEWAVVDVYEMRKPF